MSANLRLDPIELHEGFNDLAREINWDYGRPDNLCVLMTENNLGCLALCGTPNMVRDNSPPPIDSVLMVTDLNYEYTRLVIPTGRTDIEALDQEFTFQNENLAKGIGVLGANTPEAHARKNHNGPTAAVRAISLPHRSFEDIFIGKGDDSVTSRIYRYLRHGFTYADTLIGNAIGGFARDQADFRLATEAAVQNKSQLYGGAVCALLPMSPIYYQYQHRRGIVRPGTRPGHILANGAVELPEPLKRYGVCTVPYNQN